MPVSRGEAGRAAAPGVSGADAGGDPGRSWGLVRGEGRCGAAGMQGAPRPGR
jgi:hypothetical protein